MPDELEFKVDDQALATARSIVLNANFDEVAAQLREMMAPYETLVITESDVANGKNLLARIRKVKSSIDSYRRSIKKDFTAPLTEFEEKCKALTAICTESETNLSEQINKFTEQKKAEKLARLEAFFNENVGEMSPFLSFEQVQNPKWGNATYAEETAVSEIRQAIDMCADGVAAIRGLESPFEAELLADYARKHDLAGCMKKHGELTAIKAREDARREEERQRREAEQKRREEEAARREAEAAAEAAKPKEMEPPHPEMPAPPPTDAPTPAPAKEEAVYDITFRVSATRQQLVDLKAACDRIGIRIMRV